MPSAARAKVKGVVGQIQGRQESASSVMAPRMPQSGEA